MRTKRYCIAIIIVVMTATVLIPLQAMAIRAPLSAQAKKGETLLSMGAKPAPTVDRQSESKVAITRGLQKISMRDIAHAVEADDPAADAVKAVAQLLQGQTLNSGAALQSQSATHIQSQGFGTLLKKESTDRSGNRHLRVKQTYRGLPVAGAEMVVHINDQNRIYRINGKYLPSLDISVEPTISAQDAVAVGQQDLKDKTGVTTKQAPKLVIFGQRLAWHFVIAHQGPTKGQWQYYVDAASGEILTRYTDIHTAPPGGGATSSNVQGLRVAGEDGSQVTINGMIEGSTYFLYSVANIWGVYDTVVDDWEQQNSADWGSSDRAAVSAAKNIEITQAYIATRLSRNSFDDAGTMARVNVHDNAMGAANAYWYLDQLWFGDGDGLLANEMTVLDVVAHEYGHGLTVYSSDLIYENEPGALNEAYSDIFGVLVEFDTQPDGTSSYPSSTPGYSDWLMGEDCWLYGEALRNIQDPISYDYPSFYMGTNWYSGTEDFGGVHHNSSVLNHAFYLLAVGGNGNNDGYPYNITGLGIEDAGRIAMHANLNEHTSTDTYLEARQAWIDAATDLSLNVDSVRDVFDAVGVGGATAYRVTFTASSGGQITGTASQLVVVGNDTTTVTAVPNEGFGFSGWSGDIDNTDNPLIVTNVTRDMTITANFAENGFAGGGASDSDGGGSSGCFITSAVF